MISRSSSYTLFPGQVHTFPATEAMAAAQAAVKEKIVKLAEDTFCGSGDIEPTRCQVISTILYADLPA